MSMFKIATLDGWETIINNVFMDDRDPWVLFRTLTSGGPEVLRVNASRVLYVAKLDEDKS
jgi:hypothetical protein